LFSQSPQFTHASPTQDWVALQHPASGGGAGIGGKHAVVVGPESVPPSSPASVPPSSTVPPSGAIPPPSSPPGPPLSTTGTVASSAPPSSYENEGTDSHAVAAQAAVRNATAFDRQAQLAKKELRRIA
jgi:hypothetical protein